MFLGRIAAAREVGGSRDRHCDVIADVPFPLYFTLMTSNLRYVYIVHGSLSIISESQHRTWKNLSCHVSALIKIMDVAMS